MGTQIHKIHHGSNLGGATTFPLILFSMINHRGYIQMSFCPKMRISKFPKLGFLAVWKAITSCSNLWLRWVLKQSCSPHQAFSNDMWHATYTQVNQGDSRILMVGNQIGSLTPNLSFCHNLCFKYSNGSHEFNLDIYISISF